MTRVSETAGHWFGLCPKAPVIYASVTVIDDSPLTAYEGPPDSGAGGPGTIRRGVGAARSGMKTLIHNPQLLWFPLLAGLVLAGNIIVQSALRYFDRTLQTSIFVWLALNFFIEYATLFCLVFLLAGLLLCISSKKKGSGSFFVALAGAKKYLKAIFLWSFVLALAGMLLDSIFFYFPIWFPHQLGFLYGFWHSNSFLFGTLSQFPFNLTPYPPTAIFTELPGYGGRSLLLGIYPGLMEALIFLAINLFLFILTPFVVPFIVLEQKTIKEAFVGSFAMMKKTLVEVASCAVFLGVVVAGVFLTYLLVQAAHGMLTTPELAYIYRPTDMWFALGFLYDLALFSSAFVVATVGGIAVLDLFISAKTGQLPGTTEPEPHS